MDDTLEQEQEPLQEPVQNEQEAPAAMALPEEDTAVQSVTEAPAGIPAPAQGVEPTDAMRNMFTMPEIQYNIEDFFKVQETRVPLEGKIRDEYSRVSKIILGENFRTPEIEQDILDGIQQATQEVRNVRRQEAVGRVDQLLGEGADSNSIISALNNVQELENDFVFLSDLNYSAIIKEYPINNPVLEAGVQQVAQNIQLSADIQAIAQDVWKGEGLGAVVLDALELFLPTAPASESIDKMRLANTDGLTSLAAFFDRGVSADELADRLSQLPPEQQREVALQLAEDIKNSTSLLGLNSNVIMQIDQLNMLSEIISSNMNASGGVSDDESFWSAVDAATGFVGYGAYKGVKGLFKRLLGPYEKPNLTVDAAVKYRGVGLSDYEGGRRAVDEGPQAPVQDRPLQPVEAVAWRGTIISVEEAQKRLDALDVIATGKLSRVDRKTLDAERKELGNKVSRLLSKDGLEQLAQKYIEQGASRKNALRKAKQEVQPEVQALEEQRSYLNDVIRQSDTYGRAEAEASRLRQVLQDGRMKVDPDSLGVQARGTVDVIRNNTGSLVSMKIEAARPVVRQQYTGFSPEGVPNSRKLVDEGLEPIDIVQRNTISAGEVGDLKYTSFSPKAVEESVRSLGNNILVDNIGNRIIQEGIEVQKNSGGNLTHLPGNTLWSENNDARSVGDFQLFFSNGDAGFESRELAEVAGKLATGETLEAVEINGQWFLRKDFRHFFDARYDTTLFDRNIISGAGEWAKMILNPLRLLGSGNLTEAWGALEYAKSMAADIMKPAREAIKKLNSQESAALSKLLYKGDEQQQVWTKETASQVLLRPVNDKEWDAYLKARDVFDRHFDVLNQNVRNQLLRDKARLVDHPNGEDTLYVRPVKRGELDDVRQVLDMRTGKPVPLDEAQKLEGFSIMRSTSRVDLEDGNFRHVLVQDGTPRDLPNIVITKRKGHVTRSYSDRRYKVVQMVDEVVDGVPVKREKAVGIMRLEAEGEELIAALRGQAKYDGADLRVVPTRENPRDDVEDFLNESELMGYGSNNARQRGELLVGGNGDVAAIADPLESIGLTQLRLQREMGADASLALRERFLNTFRDFLDPRIQGFPRGGIKFREGVPKSVQNQAKRMYKYIEGIEGLERGVVSKLINGAMESLEEFLYKSKGVPLAGKIAGTRAFKSVVDADFQRNFMKIATYAFIIGRPLFQIPTNMMQALNIAIRYPVNGTKSMARAIGVFSVLAARESKDFPVMWKGLAKATGYNEQQMKDLLELIDESGIVKTTGTVDDFLGAVDNGIGNFGRTTDSLDRAMGITGKIISAPFAAPARASARLQEGSINYVNMVALLAEFDNAVQAGKVFNGATKADVLMRTRRLTQSQNSLDQFGYQSGANPFQFMFQFVQHVNKLFFDLVIDPPAKATLGRGVIKGNESIFAESRAVAAFTTVMVGSLFGLNGAPLPSSMSRDTTNGLREFYISMTGSDLPDEVWQVVQGGLINLMFNSVIDGKVDVTARISPAAFVDMITGMFENGLSLDVLGAFGGITKSVYDIATANTMILSTPDMDSQEKAMAIMKETYSFFSGFKDAEKAYLAYTWMNHPFMGSLSGKMRVTQEEAIMSLFSVNSELVQEMYAGFSGSARRKDLADSVSQVFVRQMNRELTELKNSGELDIQRTMETMRKWSEYAKAHVEPGQYDEVVKNFRIFMVREQGGGFQSFLRDLTEGTSFEEQRQDLLRLRNSVEFEDWKEQIDGVLQFYERYPNEVEKEL
jgi:hypothetical protein